MNGPTIMLTYRFTPAEHAVLTHYLMPSALPLNEAAQTALGVDARQLADAEEELRERRLLVRAPGEASTVAGELAELLTTSMEPDRLAIMRTILPGGARPPMYYCFTAAGITRNFVDAQGQHVFSAFDGLEQVLNELVDTSGVPSAPSAATNSSPRSLETLMVGLEAFTLLMVVDAPAQPEPRVRSLAWLVADGSLWLADTASAAQQSARLSDRAALRQTVTNMLDSD